MSVLAIDPGTRRLGVAVLDGTGRIALPLDPIRVGSRGEHLAALGRLVAERGIERIVVGLPLRLDGGEGPAARGARVLAGRIEAAVGVPVELFDERMTTAQAERDLIALGMRREDRRGRVDSAAAVLILQAWLEVREGGVVA
jgi:putative Holliday junction resolvase